MDVNEEISVPEPKRGGTFIYCPHATVETVRVPRKKPQEVVTHCKFRTNNERKYRRHWRRMHRAAEQARLLAEAQSVVKAAVAKPRRTRKATT